MGKFGARFIVTFIALAATWLAFFVVGSISGFSIGLWGI